MEDAATESECESGAEAPGVSDCRIWSVDRLLFHLIILGEGYKTATRASIRKSFRLLAVKTHPDKCKEPHAAGLFKLYDEAQRYCLDAPAELFGSEGLTADDLAKAQKEADEAIQGVKTIAMSELDASRLEKKRRPTKRRRLHHQLRSLEYTKQMVDCKGFGQITFRLFVFKDLDTGEKVCLSPSETDEKEAPPAGVLWADDFPTFVCCESLDPLTMTRVVYDPASPSDHPYFFVSWSLETQKVTRESILRFQTHPACLFFLKKSWDLLHRIDSSSAFFTGVLGYKEWPTSSFRVAGDRVCYMHGGDFAGGDGLIAAFWNTDIPELRNYVDEEKLTAWGGNRWRQESGGIEMSELIAYICEEPHIRRVCMLKKRNNLTSSLPGWFLTQDTGIFVIVAPTGPRSPVQCAFTVNCGTKQIICASGNGQRLKLCAGAFRELHIQRVLYCVELTLNGR